MKETAGEANMTVITIILIGVIVAIAIPLVTSLMSNTAKRTCCTDNGGIWKGGTCQEGSNNQSLFDEAGYNACVQSVDAGGE